MTTNPPIRFQPRRPLGRTGFVATILGIGDLADRKIPIEQCVATARRAIDAGLNLIDTAPNYEDGYSEQIVGQAVRGVRDRMFVISKIDHFHEPITPQVQASLARMRLDYVDAFVFHGLSTLDDWRRVAGPGGGMEQLDNCVRAGMVRFRGVSSHDPDTLVAALQSGLCDLVMFPVGPYVHPRYVDEILPLARKLNVGTVCFKTFGAGKLLGDTTGYNQPLQQRPRGKVSSGGATSPDAPQLPHLTVSQCLHYTLSCDPDVALLGMSFPNEQDAAFEAARSFTPLSPEQMHDIRRRAVEAIANKGRVWWNPGGI
ncbi:aldo/keto reductase [Fontivita pretiosa]|uniref:aldo/keto reductase n=1 Tax=Fontivita pretiosa TaxID=2989684 RepID=UPI003D173D3A